ncbi:hypothetical protein [Variovorax saccharolyticus]|uniref:hypothetical protein n=1 Tax=Variovorax saccharolyticus TaxID=3053516 RepID=UPI002577A9FD|nr:hypothetical protein [Variovorax sp. J22R187]MDM0018385.1 hypothetical protein [Variovorax sp. J22R187]
MSISRNVQCTSAGVPASPDSRATMYALAFANAMEKGDMKLAQAWARGLRRVGNNPARFSTALPADQL